MPAKNAEQVKQKTAALRKKLAEKKASMEPEKLRAAKKKIRRLQRRRRLLDATAKRLKSATPAKDEAPKAE